MSARCRADDALQFSASTYPLPANPLHGTPLPRTRDTHPAINNGSGGARHCGARKRARPRRTVQETELSLERRNITSRVAFKVVLNLKPLSSCGSSCHPTTDSRPPAVDVLWRGIHNHCSAQKAVHASSSFLGWRMLQCAMICNYALICAHQRQWPQPLQQQQTPWWRAAASAAATGGFGAVHVGP